MPKSFPHPYRANIWLPLVLEPDNAATINNHYLYGVGPARWSDTASRGSSATLVHRDQSQRPESGERARRLHAVAESFVIDLGRRFLSSSVRRSAHS